MRGFRIFDQIGFALVGAMVLMSAILPFSAEASERMHGLSIFGPETLKYKPGRTLCVSQPGRSDRRSIEAAGGLLHKALAVRAYRIAARSDV